MQFFSWPLISPQITWPDPGLSLVIILGFSRGFIRVFPGFSQSFSGVFPGFSRCFPEVFQGLAQGWPGVFPGFFRGFPVHSSIFQKFSRGFPRVFPISRGLSGVFQGFSQVFSLDFPRIFYKKILLDKSCNLYKIVSDYSIGIGREISLSLVCGIFKKMVLVYLVMLHY